MDAEYELLLARVGRLYERHCRGRHDGSRFNIFTALRSPSDEAMKPNPRSTGLRCATLPARLGIVSHVLANPRSSSRSALPEQCWALRL